MIEARSEAGRARCHLGVRRIGRVAKYETALARAGAPRIRHASACTSASTKRLAHLVEAGADIFLMPSRFEPCGLNQMYSLRYGTVPIVHAVGGLDDTIQPYTARANTRTGSSSRGHGEATGAGRSAGDPSLSQSHGLAAARAERHVARSTPGRPPPGNMSKCIDGHARDRRAQGRPVTDSTKGRTDRHGIRAHADVYRRQLRRATSSRRRPRCSWISGRSGAVRAARWSRRSPRSRPTTSARCGRQAERRRQPEHHDALHGARHSDGDALQGRRRSSIRSSAWWTRARSSRWSTSISERPSDSERSGSHVPVHS